MQTFQFQHNGRDYEIRVVSDGETVYVRAFCGGKPANGYRYSVTFMTALDLQKVCGYDGVKDLINTAKADVVEGRWEKYVLDVSGA